MCGAGVGGDYSSLSGTGQNALEFVTFLTTIQRSVRNKKESSPMQLRSALPFTLGLTFLMVFVWTKASSLFSSAT